MTKQLFAVRLADDCHAAIAAAERIFECSKTEAIQCLMVDGVKAILAKSSIDPFFLKGLDTVSIFRLFWQYADALLYGGKSSYYLADVPQCGYWADNGVSGKAVLHRSSAFTNQGLSHDLKAAEQYPAVPEWIKGE